MLEKSLCPLPWLSLSFNTDTSLRVCCNTDHGGHIKSDSGENIHLNQLHDVKQTKNLNTYKQLRSQMLKGERPEFCRSCYQSLISSDMGKQHGRSRANEVAANA